MAAAFSTTARLQGPPRANGWRGVMWLVGSLIAGVATLVAAVLAVFLAFAVAAVALIGGALLALGGFACRTRRATRRPGDDGIIDARRVGGHSWVAYGWDGRS